MRIAMFTNTYLPHVGGVANSVARFARAYRKKGHQVLIVAPTYRDQENDEKNIVRIPAIQNFNGSDFSVALPFGGELESALDEFRPEILHSHHPFLIGNTALRAAAERNLPLVFTHHTMYEHYTHYVPAEMEAMRKYAADLSTGYANMCDQVIAPSESVESILRERNVATPVAVVPTGVNLEEFSRGNGGRFRRERAIPDAAFVIGHVGRLAPEKNLAFLAEAVGESLGHIENSRFLVVGSGPSEKTMLDILRKKAPESRLCFAGTCEGEDLVNAYHAMDVFVFASKTETQGMVLVEALAASCPVVAVDAPGAREVVQDKKNGRLLMEDDPRDFADAIAWVAKAQTDRRARIEREAFETAKPFATDVCVEKALSVYRETLLRERKSPQKQSSEWASLLRALKCEWDIWSNRVRSAADAVAGSNDAETVEESR